MAKLSINQKLLKKALEFERSLHKNGIIKNYPVYMATLDEYAQKYGMPDFDTLIMELGND